VNNLCFPSLVAPGYAPEGSHLASVSVVREREYGTDEQLDQAARDQLTDWYGDQVNSWRLLRIYRIAHALPAMKPPALSPVRKPSLLADGIFVCGDYCDTASLQGALASGQRAATAVVEHLSAAND
jgi:predicted NAD/FAD-dependent oxidoreductase